MKLDIDWHVWALPLSIAKLSDALIVRIGPVCLQMGGQKLDRTPYDAEAALDRLNKLTRRNAAP